MSQSENARFPKINSERTAKCQCKIAEHYVDGLAKGSHQFSTHHFQLTIVKIKTKFGTVHHVVKDNKQ